MRSTQKQIFRESQGATSVEFALVFLFVVLPLVLFGMQLILSTFIRQQATAGARDGARAGAVSYAQADVDASDDYNRVVAAVNRTLAFAPSAPIDVTCRQFDAATSTSGLPAEVVGGCAKAQRGLDRIEVSVTLKPIKVVGPFGIFLGPLLPGDITSTASIVVENDGKNT